MLEELNKVIIEFNSAPIKERYSIVNNTVMRERIPKPIGLIIDNIIYTRFFGNYPKEEFKEIYIFDEHTSCILLGSCYNGKIKRPHGSFRGFVVQNTIYYTYHLSSDTLHELKNRGYKLQEIESSVFKDLFKNEYE